MASMISGGKIQRPSTYFEIVIHMLLERILWTRQSPEESSTWSGPSQDKLDSLLTVQQSGTSDGRKELKTAGALFTKKGGDKRCAFCLGGHLPVDCKKVQDIGEWKKLSLKYGRCFSCIEKSHRSHYCSITVERKLCNWQHICPLGKWI